MKVLIVVEEKTSETSGVVLAPSPEEEKPGAAVATSCRTYAVCFYRAHPPHRLARFKRLGDGEGSRGPQLGRGMGAQTVIWDFARARKNCSAGHPWDSPRPTPLFVLELPVGRNASEAVRTQEWGSGRNGDPSEGIRLLEKVGAVSWQKDKANCRQFVRPCAWEERTARVSRRALLRASPS